MSEDVIARRARALESLLGAAPEEAEPVDPREAMTVSRIGALLGHPGTWQAPPPGLPDVLLAEIRRPATEPEPAAETRPESDGEASPVSGPALPEGSPTPRRRWWARPQWTPPRLALGLAGALAALLLVVVMFGGDLLGIGDGPERQIQLAGTSAAPQAHAEIRATERAAGWRLVVDIDGLAPAPPDGYYQGWAVSGQEMVPLGTFHMRERGEVELWSGVPLKQFSRIEVTAQRVGAGQTPGVLVMVGQL
jgi:anti-sigma-K factor RskA